MSTVTRSMGLLGQADRRPVHDLIEVLRQPVADSPVVEGPLGEALGDARDELVAVGVRPPVAQGDEPEHRSAYHPRAMVGDELGLEGAVVAVVALPRGADPEVSTEMHCFAVPDESAPGA